MSTLFDKSSDIHSIDFFPMRNDNNIQRLMVAMARFGISIDKIVQQCNYLNVTINAYQLTNTRFLIESKENYSPLAELNKILESQRRVEKLCNIKNTADLKAAVLEFDLYHLFQYLYTTGQIDMSLDDLKNGAAISQVLESQIPTDQDAAEKTQGASDKVTVKNLGSGRRIEMFLYASRITSRQVMTLKSSGGRQIVWRYKQR
jgi:hypothetical protein